MAWEKECREVEDRNATLMQGWEAKNGAHLEEGRKQRGAIPEKQAYTAAMKALQDRYYEQVGKLCALLRDGPRRERLSTQEYDRRKQSAKKLSSALDRTENHAEQFLELKEDYKQKAASLAAKTSEFDEGVTAREELVDQIEDGRASVTGDHFEMDKSAIVLSAASGGQ